ncbi:MAG: hypothetical protein ABIJ18_00935 [archaeon]
MNIDNKVVDELIVNLVGEDVLPLLNLIRDKPNFSEFKLAEQLNITVNQVRNMLYRMYEQSLVTFMRKKDKKKGWYIYYWTLNKDKVREALIKFKKQQLEEFNKRLQREQDSQFYFCSNGCMRLTMEAAMENDFRCHECGNLLGPQDNSRTIENVKQRIIEIEKDLSTPMVTEKVPRVKKVAKKKEKKVEKKAVKKEKKVEKKVVKKKKKVEKKEKISYAKNKKNTVSKLLKRVKTKLKK